MAGQQESGCQAEPAETKDWVVPAEIKKKKKAKRLSETSGDEGRGVVHSRVCRFMSASFVTTEFGRSGNTETTRLGSVDKGQGVLEGQ